MSNADGVLRRSLKPRLGTDRRGFYWLGACWVRQPIHLLGHLDGEPSQLASGDVGGTSGDLARVQLEVIAVNGGGKLGQWGGAKVGQ
jgi:hypothetical protein